MTKTFARASTAYDNRVNALAANQPARETRSRILSAVSPTFPTGQGVGGVDVAPTWAAETLQGDGTRTASLAVGYASNGLYWTDDGENWTRFAEIDDARDDLICWQKQDGTYSALALTGVLANGLAVELWDDITGTPVYTRCQHGGDDFTYPATKHWLKSAAYDPDTDVVVASEYGLPIEQDIYIYRSTDGGKNWTTVETVTTRTSTNANHCHGVFCLKLIKRDGSTQTVWVHSMGDSNNRGVMLSLDDGATWFDAWPRGNVPLQPIMMYPIGNGIVRSCEDTFGGLVDIDLETILDQHAAEEELADIYPVLTIHDLGLSGTDSDDGFIWDWLRLPSGVEVATHYDINGEGHGALLARRGSVGPWTTVHRYRSGYRGIWGMWYFEGGKILAQDINHANAAREATLLDPPSLTTARTWEVAPASTNLLSADQSRMETTTGFFSLDNTQTMELVSDPDAPEGSQVIKLSNTANAGIRLGLANVTLADGEVVDGMVWVKGTAASPAFVQWWSQPASGGAGYDAGSVRAQPLGDSYQPLYAPAFPAVADGAVHRLSVGISLIADGTITNELYVALGHVSKTGCPQRWQIGGTARAAELLVETRARGASWTDVNRVWPTVDHTLLVNARYIVSYEAGDSSASLYFDGSDDKLKLAVVVDGVASTVVESSAIKLNRNEQIDIAASFDSEGTTFVVTVSGVDYTLEGDPTPDLLNATVTTRFSDTSGANQLPMAVEVPSPLSTGVGMGMGLGIG